MSAIHRLFGEKAIDKNYITASQLFEALRVQAEEVTHGGRYRFIGEVLTDLGYLSEAQVVEILNERQTVED